MAGNLSDYLEDKVLDHILGTTTYTKPSAVYLALYTTTPTDSTSGTEVSGGSYARQLITFGASSSGAASNNTSVDFSLMPACTVTGVAVCDAQTSGHILVYGSLSSSKTLAANDTLRVSSGDLSISIN